MPEVSSGRRTVRYPAVAGTFYPAEPTQLKSQVNGFLETAKPARNSPKAIIAPHAGYIYSGPVAGSAYATLSAAQSEIKKVLLLGPAHRVYVSGIAASSASAFRTPLGDVALDQAAISEMVQYFEFVVYDDHAHELEHCLEVQLPFLQSVIPNFLLIPLAVGDASPKQVQSILDTLGCDESILIVVSSDLSHYRNYTEAHDIDQHTAARIQALNPAGLTGENACGQRPVCGLLQYAAKYNLQCDIIDLRNSGDTAGGRDQVVGYGAFAFYP